VAGRQFVPDPPPIGTNPVLAEWLVRQLRRIDQSTSEIVKYQEVGGGELGDVQNDLYAHIQNKSDPHDVLHAQLADVAANLTHAQIDTDLVRKAGDTMTGNLVLDGTAGEVDLILKGEPIDLAAPANGAALLLHDAADVQLGGVAAVTTNPADPDNVSMLVGSLDESLLVVIEGAGAVIAPENIAIGTPGAVLGSRLVCSGFTTSGFPVLAWEDPPPSVYTDSCSNATDFQVWAGTGTGTWVEVCIITTTQQIEASQASTIYWSIHADNRSSRTGNMEVAFTRDATPPTAPEGIPIQIAANMDEIVSGSIAYPSGVTYPVGTTLHFHVRASGDHAQFNLWSAGTANPATMTLQVR